MRQPALCQWYTGTGHPKGALAGGPPCLPVRRSLEQDGGALQHRPAGRGELPGNLRVSRLQPVRLGGNAGVRTRRLATQVVWVALVLAVKNDVTVEETKKQHLLEHASLTKGMEDLEAKVLVCQQKKAFKQNGWNTDMYRVELFTIPEHRPVCFELMEAIMSKPHTIRKPGAPPRGPNSRHVVQDPRELAEYQAEEGQ